MENFNQVCKQEKRYKNDDKRHKNIFKLIILLKIMYILLALISTFNTIKIISFQSKYDLYMINTILCIITIMYLSWSSIYRKDVLYDKFKCIDCIESLVLMIIFILVITSTGSQNSCYKILSILAIIIGAIQFGHKYSLCISICYSAIIIGIDIYSNKYGLDILVIYLEKDIILMAILLIISFVLGIYVDTERQYFKELMKVANMDELTGIYNYRYFQETLSNLIEESKYNIEVSLLFMDIDYFKHYNDTHGHQAGDLLLREVGDLLRVCTRSEDVVARYGGEEFAVILPNTGQEDAIKIAEKIRNCIDKKYFKGQEFQPNGKITISIGISTYPTTAYSKYQLISTADNALYKAKSFNRNKVEHYNNISI